MTVGRVTLLGLGAAFVIACFMLVRSAYVKHYAIVDTTPPWIYFRYVDDDSPPLEEAYVFRDGSWLLFVVCYDSDGNWIPDRYVQFKTDTTSAVPLTEGRLPEESTDPLPRRSQVRRVLHRTRLVETEINKRLTVPHPLSSLNNARFATSQYQKAVEVTHSIAPTGRRPE